MIRVNKKIIVLSIMVLIFAYISGGNLPYSIFYVLAATIILGLIYMYISKKSLSAKLRYDSKSYNVGDSANITIIVENSWIIPTPYVYVESKVLSSLIEGYCGDFIFIGIDKSKWIVNKIFFRNRGIYDFGDIYLEVSDLFCIFTSIIKIHKKLDIRVYPKIYDLFDIKLCGQDSYENLINSKSGIDDFTLIKDIRKYNIGDNLKKVHWKLSAKYGEMYVKNFEETSGKECNLFVNMHIDNLQNDLFEIIEEDMVDFSVSLTKHMISIGIKTRLFINEKQQKNIEVGFEEDFLGVMEYFLKSKSDGNLEFSGFIKSNLKHIPKKNWIGIVSIVVDDNLRNVIMNLNEMGYTVNVFYYENILDQFKNINFLKSVGIECINFKFKEKR